MTLDIPTEGDPSPIVMIPVNTPAFFSLLDSRLLQEKDLAALNRSFLCMLHVRASMAEDCVD